MTNSRTLAKFVLALTLLGASLGYDATAAQAATVTWNVAGSGTWNTSTGNWTGGSPTANLYVNGDTAIFNNAAGGTITLSGTIAPAATTVNSSGTYTFAGTGLTSGTLTKQGAGTLILTNANTYAGGTTVSAGELRIGNNTAGTISTGATSIAANATLRFNTTSYNGGSTYNGNLTGAGDVIIAGAATSNLMRFNGDNSGFTGSFTVLSGSRSSLHSAAAGSAAARFVIDGTLSGQAGNGNTHHLGELSGASTGSLGGGGTTTIVDWSVGALNTSTTFAGTFLATSRNLTKVGSGTLTLTGANLYTGTTTINAGTLALSGGNNRIATAGTVAFTGASTFDIGATQQTLVNMTAGNNITGDVNGSGGKLTLTGSAFSLGGASQNTTQTLNMSGLTTFEYNNAAGTFRVSGTPNVNGQNGAAGVLTLASGTNTISALAFGLGNINGSLNGSVNSGTVNLGTTNTINADSITVGGSRGAGTLQYLTGNNTSLTLRGSDGTSRVTSMILSDTGGPNIGGQVGTVNLTSNVTGASTLDAMFTTLTIGKNNRAASAGGNTLINTGTFTMGAGTLDATTIILAQNTAGFTSGGATSKTTGNLTVTGGTIKVNNFYFADQNTSGGTGSALEANFNLNGGANLYAASIAKGLGAGTHTATRTFNWNHGTIHNYDAATNLIIDSGITWNIASTGTHTFDIDSGRNAAVNATLAGANGTIVKAGAGTVTYYAANSYTGLTTVSAGTLAYGVSNAISTGGVTVNGSTAVLSLGAFSDSVGTVTLDGGGQITSSTGVLTSTGTFEMKRGSASAILAGGGLNKTTSGTVTLTGANTYTGATAVSGGKLLVNGSHTGGALYTVGAGATLGGGGTISAAVTVASGGITSPGNSPGTLTVGSLDYDSGAVHHWEITGSYVHDIVNITGLLNFDGLMTINVFNLGVTTPISVGDSFIVWDYGTLSGFNAANFTIADGGGFVDVSGAYVFNNGSQILISGLQALAVPEPSTLVLAAGGMVGLVWFARRRKGMGSL